MTVNMSIISDRYNVFGMRMEDVRIVMEMFRMKMSEL
jgi:hypothetical protein